MDRAITTYQLGWWHNAQVISVDFTVLVRVVNYLWWQHPSFNRAPDELRCYISNTRFLYKAYQLPTNASILIPFINLWRSVLRRRGRDQESRSRRRRTEIRRYSVSEDVSPSTRQRRPRRHKRLPISRETEICYLLLPTFWNERAKVKSQLLYSITSLFLLELIVIIGSYIFRNVRMTLSISLFGRQVWGHMCTTIYCVSFVYLTSRILLFSSIHETKSQFASQERSTKTPDFHFDDLLRTWGRIKTTAHSLRGQKNKYSR